MQIIGAKVAVSRAHLERGVAQNPAQTVEVAYIAFTMSPMSRFMGDEFMKYPSR